MTKIRDEKKNVSITREIELETNFIYFFVSKCLWLFQLFLLVHETTYSTIERGKDHKEGNYSYR